MVRVWVADASPLLEEEKYLYYYDRLPQWRKDKADHLAGMKSKACSAAVWSLWEHVKDEYELSDDTIYNLSHSDHYVMCAYSDKADVEVGCDLEKIGKQRLSVAKRFYCEAEYQHIVSMKSEEEQRQMFYRYWVLKESFMKATREGMGLDMRSYEIGWNEMEEPILIKQPEKYSSTYYYKEYKSADIEAKMAVCTTDGEIDGMLHVLEL